MKPDWGVAVIPTDEDVAKFREELRKIGAEKAAQNLRHQIYGMKDSWKHKETESFVQACEDAIDLDIKRASLQEQRKANNTARWALGVSILSIAVSGVAVILHFFF